MGEPDQGGLGRIVGAERENRYVGYALASYVLALIALSLAAVDSPDAVVEALADNGRSLERDDGAGDPIFGDAALTAAVLSTALTCLAASLRESSVRVSGFVKLGVHATVALLLMSFVLFVAIGLVGAVAYVVVGFVLALAGVGEFGLLVYGGAAMELLFVVSFAVATLVAVTQMQWILPAELRGRANELHETLDEADDKLDAADDALTEDDVETAAEAVERAADAIEEVRDADDAPRGAVERTDAIVERAESTARAVIDAAADAAERDLGDGDPTSAAGTYACATTLAGRFELDDDRADLPSIESELAEQVADAEAAVEDALDRAETRRGSGDLAAARRALDDADDALDRLRDLLGATDLDPDADPDDLASRVDDARHLVDRDESEQAIEAHRASIADALGIPESEVRVAGNPSADDYARLESLVTDVQSAKRAYRDRPWDALERSLVDELPGVSTGRIGDYERIVADATDVLSFLRGVAGVHPSVEPDAWGNAVDGALTEQRPEELSAVSSTVARFEEGGIWTRDQLTTISWEEFEELVGALYERRGYAVRVTRGTADMGVDVWAERDGTTVAIQAKQYSDGNTVGRETLQKLASTLAKGDADRAVVVTSGAFARTAREYALEFGPELDLVDGDDLVALLNESELPPPG